MSDRPYDIVAFGATGFTGGLAAEYLAAHAPKGTRWAVAETRHRVIATVACHSVARAGQPLNVQQMQGIVAGLVKIHQYAIMSAPTIAQDAALEALTNGVETSLFRPVEPTLPQPGDGRRRLVVPRRLFEKNGVEHLVRAMPIILERVDVEAVLAHRLGHRRRDRRERVDERAVEIEEHRARRRRCAHAGPSR